MDISKIADRSTRNEVEIKNLRDALWSLERGANKLQPRGVEDHPALPARNQQTKYTYYKAGAIYLEQQNARVKKFELSRRSLRVWPIEGGNPTEISDNLRSFMKGAC